jgi:hypothetical protein
MIEVRGERLALVPERPRGAPPTPACTTAPADPGRHPALPVRTSLYADAVQNVRAFGTEVASRFSAWSTTVRPGSAGA